MKAVVSFLIATTFVGSTVLGLPKLLVGLLRATSPQVLFSVETDQPLVALTIDDGPSEATPEILDVLEQHHARATFFLIGERVREQPERARSILERGSEVAHHMMSDEPSLTLPPAEFQAHFEQMDSILRDFGGARFFRPASGWYNNRLIREADRLGYRVVLGSVYPFDAQLPYPSAAAWYVVENAKPGSIIILHDGVERGARTAEVLRRVLPELRRRGLQVVTLGELVRGSEQVSPLR